MTVWRSSSWKSRLLSRRGGNTTVWHEEHVQALERPLIQRRGVRAARAGAHCG